MSGNSCVVISGLSSAILRAPSPDGASTGGQRMSCVPFVISRGRSIVGDQRREVHLLHRQARLSHRVRVVDPDHRAHGLERVLALLALEERRAHRLGRDVVGEVVPRHRFGHSAPDAEEGRAIDVGLRERDVRARGDHAGAVARGERDGDHPAHRGAVHEDALERQRVEELRAVVGPALDRVPLARARRGAVAPRVEREQPVPVLAEPVVDEPEVVAAEEPAAELDHDRAVLGPRQLVVEVDSLVDPRVRHPALLGLTARPSLPYTRAVWVSRINPSCDRRDPRRRRSGATRC